MRNKRYTAGASSIPVTGRRRAALAAIFGLGLMPLLGGCLDGPSREVLTKGYQALESQRYEDADSDADEFLRAHPTGTGTAEAFMLKGRVDEVRAQDPQASPTDAQKRENLEAARDNYQRGLNSLPPSNVTALLRMQIANIDYFEEDYAAALRGLQLAYENLQKEDAKAWALYRIGTCQQRMDLFEEADKTFAKVQRNYPGSPAAERAATRSGIRAFFVEVGTFDDAAFAEKSADALRKKGYDASRRPDLGRQIVRVGPVSTYREAKALKMKLRAMYPGAVIHP